MKTKIVPKYNVGDIVEYLGSRNDPFDNTKWTTYHGDRKFIGNRMIINEVSITQGIISYSVLEYDKVPYTAWHKENALKLIKPIDYSYKREK